MSKVLAYIKQHKLILIVDAVLLIAYIMLSVVAHNMTASLYSQQEALRWENEDIKDTAKSDSSDDKKLKLSEIVGGKSMSYAQVSAFISPARGMDNDGLSGVRSSLQEALVKDSYAESQTGGRVWIDAYSCEANISLRKDSNTLSVTAVGVGGDFFQFHPMTLLSGSYISDSDLNHDRIVVDENFAWAMFGSNDIVGMQVWLGDNIYFISGVVKVDEDDISQMAYGNGNRVYMCYDELKKQNEKLPITCYEAVYPNPISNYAFNALRNAFGLSDENNDQLDKQKDNPLSFDDVEIIDNTKRYETMELITNLKYWRLRSMRASSVGYPFWENVARVQDDTQMILIVIRGLLLIVPVISFIWLIYGLWEMKTWTVKGLLLEEIDKTRERRAWKAYEAGLEAEEAEDDNSEHDAADNYEGNYENAGSEYDTYVNEDNGEYDNTEDVNVEYGNARENGESENAEDEDGAYKNAGEEDDESDSAKDENGWDGEDDSEIENGLETQEGVELRSITGDDLFK